MIFLAYGGLRRRRGQADLARPSAALRQAEGQREEPEAVRTSRCPGIQPGVLIFTNCIITFLPVCLAKVV